MSRRLDGSSELMPIAGSTSSMDSDEESVLLQLKELDELASIMKLEGAGGNDDSEEDDGDEGGEGETADAILKELEELDRLANNTQGYAEYTAGGVEEEASSRDLDQDELSELRRLIQKRELLKEKLRILKKREMLQNKLKELERQKRAALRRRAEHSKHEASSPNSSQSTPMEDSSIIEADLGFKTRGFNNEIKFEKANLDDSTSPDHSLIGIEHEYYNQSIDCLSGRIFRKAVGRVVKGIATSVTKSHFHRSLEDSGYTGNTSHLLSFDEHNSSSEKSQEEVQAMMDDLLNLEVSVLNDSIDSETKELQSLPSPSPSRRRNVRKDSARGQDKGSEKTANLLAELAELEALSQQASQARKSLNVSMEEKSTNIMKPKDGWSKAGGAGSPVDVVTLC
uniref:Uncharacterized protein n=1 Tax=Guillardia theta TaxID=55529 RepID=A0A7S4JFD4_GUITH|mmetsp:Transcript_15970/g.53467  ORF Transcript_15970/g.53467 Transcript_15970/m.53467 type:complete len:397 (+) Transcript_15970:176-1366(+)